MKLQKESIRKMLLDIKMGKEVSADDSKSTEKKTKNIWDSVKQKVFGAKINNHQFMKNNI